MLDNKVLVYVPTYRENGKLAIHQETEKAVRRLKGEKQIVWAWDNPYPIDTHKGMNITYQLNRARDALLIGDFTHLMIIEHDMIPPENALVEMVEFDKDVVYAAYAFRHGPIPVLNIYRKTCMPEPDQSWQHIKNGEPKYPDIIKQKRIPCSGAGTGCILIKRHVLENIKFRSENNGSPDLPFAADVAKAGFEQWGCFDIVCGHIRPDGVVLWPEYVEADK